jgi:predicted membrane metal-binding protein
MKLPSLAITGAFACGIALGLHPAVRRHASSEQLILVSVLVALFLILGGMLLVKAGCLFPAALASVLTWIVLGFVGTCVAEQPRSAEHVICLLDQGRLDLKTPLRWHGHLRDEPSHLPWGYGYEIELSGVEHEGPLMPATGGLRVSFSPHSASEFPPDFHAGDKVTVLTEARRPPVFRGEGAFDRRAYLEQQHIDLVAELRAPQLMERVSSELPTMATRLARV